MFDLKSPCINCPFKIGLGSNFRLPEWRLNEIRNGPAFQCHKTVDYDGPDKQGDKPMQCAGLIGVLLHERAPNQIMQVATTVGYVDFATYDKTKCYQSWDDAIAAHVKGEEPSTKEPTDECN